MTHHIPSVDDKRQTYWVKAFGREYRLVFHATRPVEIFTRIATTRRALGSERMFWHGYGAGMPLKGRAAELVSLVMNPEAAQRAGAEIEDTQMRRARTEAAYFERERRQAEARAAHEAALAAVAAKEANREKLAAAAPVLANALRVFLKTPELRSYLDVNDPMAVRQALEAVALVEEAA